MTTSSVSRFADFVDPESRDGTPWRPAEWPLDETFTWGFDLINVPLQHAEAAWLPAARTIAVMITFEIIRALVMLTSYEQRLHVGRRQRRNGSLVTGYGPTRICLPAYGVTVVRDDQT